MRGRNYLVLGIITGLLIGVVVSSYIQSGYSHSGRTDECGGHYDKKTGEYHIHDYAKWQKCQEKEAKLTASKEEKKEEKAEISEQLNKFQIVREWLIAQIEEIDKKISEAELQLKNQGSN